jgi:hypothetical protein
MRLVVILFCAALLTSRGVAQTSTASDVIHRIQQRYPAPVADTVDTVKAGDPSTPVTGIATTFLDTMDVLREANRRGLNLVITHEPTFYNHRDNTVFFSNDPVYQEKLAFIEQHHMVVPIILHWDYWRPWGGRVMPDRMIHFTQPFHL